MRIGIEDVTASAGREADAGSAAELVWVVHPMRRQHAKTALLIAVLALTAAFIYLNTASLGWTAASLLILLFGVLDYVVPVTFSLTDWGVESKLVFYRRRKPWSMLRSYHLDRNGILVSPFPARSRLETFRGLYLRFSGNRDDVVGFIRDRLERATP
jgi:hypothetical protein